MLQSCSGQDTGFMESWASVQPFCWEVFSGPCKLIVQAGRMSCRVIFRLFLVSILYLVTSLQLGSVRLATVALEKSFHLSDPRGSNTYSVGCWGIK